MVGRDAIPQLRRLRRTPSASELRFEDRAVRSGDRCHVASHLLLQRGPMLGPERLVVRGGPKLCSAAGLDEPHGNARFRGVAAHAARQQVAARRRGVEAFHMARAIPARLARDDEDIELVEPQHDLFGHARRDGVERGIRAEILERHDDDARPLGALRLAEGLERAVGFA